MNQSTFNDVSKPRIKMRDIFEGNQITTIELHGRPCWIAREIGQAMGYEQDGRKFVNQVTLNWADEFVFGVDYYSIEGDDLKSLKQILGDLNAPNLVSTKTNYRCLVLFESGVYLSCLKTSKPAGKALRRFLVERILPELVRSRERGSTARCIANLTLTERERMGKELVDLVHKSQESGNLDPIDARRFTVAAFANFFDDHLLIVPSANRLQYSGRPMPGEYALYKLGPEYGFERGETKWDTEYELFLLKYFPPDQVGGAKLQSQYGCGYFRPTRRKYPMPPHLLAGFSA